MEHAMTEAERKQDESTAKLAALRPQQGWHLTYL